MSLILENYADFVYQTWEWIFFLNVEGLFPNKNKYSTIYTFRNILRNNSGSKWEFKIAITDYLETEVNVTGET